ITPSAAAGTPAGSPAPSVPGVPAGWAPVAAAEIGTAQAQLAELAAASPELARLLASVAAGCALRAVQLGDQAPFPADPADADPSTAGASSTLPSPVAPATPGQPGPSAAKSAPAGSPSVSPAPTGGPSAGAVTALQAALAGEHTAVYAYGVIGARIPPGPQRDDAQAGYAAHQARRDAWQRMLTDAGATPAPAAPGYQLPFPVTDPNAASTLAGTVEARLTPLYADLVAAGSGPLRAAAATALRECTLQAYHWGNPLGPLPGLPAAAGSGATPSGPPSPGPSA
ncbi:DUF4439 domain-containing protein, partial [Kitasatospora sp. LaBMicrA B282]|uniref:ferritin-like domain-containing protein n=1 Tax=Kitasatospora sp. LaBMicrA B282 TaxID=3420949 RepID=UPI003D104F69